jgi:hypothetical protein
MICPRGCTIFVFEISLDFIYLFITMFGQNHINKSANYLLNALKNLESQNYRIRSDFFISSMHPSPSLVPNRNPTKGLL